MSVQIAKRCFTVAEYYRMAEAGILTEDDRVELIEGEIIEMSPIGSRHAACVGRLTEILLQHVVGKAIVWVQNPVRLDEYNEPEQDVALLKRRVDFYSERHPTPADVLLVVEVADTSTVYDRSIKVPLYARAEISEVWLVDLTKEVIEVYAQPVNGAYQISRKAGRSESITSQTIPELTLSVDAILG
ncbi:MAG: Uma2 family endonuclease [Pyrinomonadaceae bacterium]